MKCSKFSLLLVWNNSLFLFRNCSCLSPAGIPIRFTKHRGLPLGRIFSILRSFWGKMAKIKGWYPTFEIGVPCVRNPGSATADHHIFDLHNILSFWGLYVCIGGSKGGHQGRAPPPGGPNSFIFMQFSAKIWKIIAILRVGAPPWGKSWIRHWFVKYYHYREENSFQNSL